MSRTALLAIGCLLIALAGPFFAVAPAQAADATAAQIQALREQIKADKRGLVAKNMQLSEAEAARFWPIYDAFQMSAEALQRRRSRAILDFVAAGDGLTDASARQIAEELLAVEQAEARMHRDYFGKLARALPARKAARYLQIESKIEALYRYDLAVTIPLVH